MYLFENNEKLTGNQVDEYFNEIYSKDANGKYKKLKFYDYKGEINYIGKSDNELNIDEIVRLKKSCNQFYELFNDISSADVESIKLASNLLKTPFTEIVFYTRKIDNGLLYISIPTRCSSIIINPKTKEYLFAEPTIDFDTHFKKFMSGERTKNFK